MSFPIIRTIRPNSGSGSSGSSSKDKTVGDPTAAPTGKFVGTPQTIFPQYTSGAWANLPPSGPAQISNGQFQGTYTPKPQMTGLFGGGMNDMRGLINSGQFDLPSYIRMLMGR